MPTPSDITTYYGIGLPGEVIQSQRVLNGLLQAIADCDYYLWVARMERQWAREREWNYPIEHEPTLTLGEGR